MARIKDVRNVQQACGTSAAAGSSEPGQEGTEQSLKAEGKVGFREEGAGLTWRRVSEATLSSWLVLRDDRHDVRGHAARRRNISEVK